MSMFLRRRGAISSVKQGVSSLAFHDDAYSNTSTIDITGLGQAGDLAILSDCILDKKGSLSLVTPAGFTPWINFVSTFVRIAVSYKILTGSETVLTGMHSDLTDDKILAIFRGNKPITSITASTPTTEVTSGNPTAQNINADGAGTLPLIAFGFYGNGFGSTVSTRTMTPSATAELNGGAIDFHYMKYLLQNVTLVDVSVDGDDEGADNMLAGGFLWAA